MRLLLKRKNIKVSLDDFVCNLICVLIFTSSYFSTINARNIYENPDSIYAKLYRIMTYLIVAVILAKLVIDTVNTGRLYRVVGCMMMMFAYIAFVSFAMGLFPIYLIIIDNLSWILVFCLYYMYGRKKNISNNSIFGNIVIFGTVLFCIIVAPNLRAHIMGQDPQGGIIGTIYYLIGYLGLILLVCSNKQKIVFSAVVSVMLLFSSKRAGLIVVVLGLLGYFFADAMIEGRVRERMKKYGKIIIVLIVGLIAASFLIEYFSLNILERLSSIATDGGSDRDIIWANILNRYRESDMLHKLFGHGFHAVPEIIRPFNRYIFAHNGFLEALFDFGVLGLTTMIAGILWLCVCTLKMIKRKAAYAPVMVYTMAMVFIFSLVSYFFEEARYIMPAAVIGGLCIGRLDSKQLRQ